MFESFLLKFPAFLGEVNPESIYDAQMFNKKPMISTG